MVNETHNGNLNRSKSPAPAKDEGLNSTGKSNDPEASLRKTNLPKSEAVTTVDRDKNKSAAIHAAQFQNESLTPDGRRILNQPPSGSGKNVSTTSGGN